METGMRFFNDRLQEIVFDEIKGYPFRDWFTDNVYFIYIIDPDKAVLFLEDEELDEFAMDVDYYCDREYCYNYKESTLFFYYDSSEDSFRNIKNDIDWYQSQANDLKKKRKALWHRLIEEVIDNEPV